LAIQRIWIPDTVISEIISGLASKRKPTPGDLRERHAFYTEITMGLARLDRLSRVPNIDIDELDTILYSKTILKDLFKLIPREDDIKFRTHMSEKKLDYKNPSGICTFAFFKEPCETERDVLEPYKGIVNPTPKPRAVHNVNQGNSPTCKDPIAIHATRYSPPRTWYKPGAIFPCPLSGHSHEMYECREFFSLNPYTRWDLSGKGKICFTCANTNLITEKIALDQGLQLISKKPSKLTVVGGGTIQSEIGKFRFNIGPTESGEFHEIKCQGMRNITSKFPKINLSSISDEFKNSPNSLYDGEPLPEYVGGDEIGLLVGIKNARMNPTLITVLPSGVGVYKSPFADIWGSRYIFAGPHAVFSGGDTNKSDGLTHAIFHMKESILNYRGGLKEIPISIPIDKRFNITIHPTPVQEQDLIELGGGTTNRTG